MYYCDLVSITVYNFPNYLSFFFILFIEVFLNKDKKKALLFSLSIGGSVLYNNGILSTKEMKARNELLGVK